MKLIKIIISLIVSFLFAIQIMAQDSTKAFYFPHRTGDLWQYSYNDGMYFNTQQNITIFDSTDSNGLIHIIQYAQFIRPIGKSQFLADTSRYLIDTAGSKVYSMFNSTDIYLEYKLKGQKGDKWIMKTIHIDDTTYGYYMARVANKWKGTLFSKSTTFMQINSYWSTDSLDTLGLESYGANIIADGFGLVQSGGGESMGEIYLTGAVINGTLYGDTTRITGINNEYSLDIPDQFILSQNYPNPFNPSTTIKYSIPKAGNVKLTVYNAIGSKVATIVNEYKSAGNYSVEFNGSNLASGIYLYRLEAGGFSTVKKLILLK